MEKWVIAAKRADFYGIAEKFGIDPVIARLIRNRDVEGEENIRRYLNGDLSELPSYWLLKDMEKAVGILEKKIKEKKKIRIIGDYDIDGVTATYILLTGLRRLGAAVDTYIPDRIADGYGIHEPLILKAREDQVDTILTCDNGIAAGEEIKKAKEWGMTVVVTDHHEIPYREGKEGREFLLPPADALLNPKQPSCGYPNKNICGAAVAWKLIGALYETFGIDKKEYYDFLEFAAIATVGDVMDLQGENRILVKEGLKKLPHGLPYWLCTRPLHQCQRKIGHSCPVSFSFHPDRPCTGCKDSRRPYCTERQQKGAYRKGKRRGGASGGRNACRRRPGPGPLPSELP